MQEQNRYYINPETGDRLSAVYQVHLVMPATHNGYVDVAATSENEAVRLALEEHFTEVQWDYDKGDTCAVEVLDVECEEPPENGILIEQGHYTGNANLGRAF